MFEITSKTNGLHVETFIYLMITLTHLENLQFLFTCRLWRDQLSRSGHDSYHPVGGGSYLEISSGCAEFHCIPTS